MPKTRLTDPADTPPRPKPRPGPKRKYPFPDIKPGGSLYIEDMAWTKVTNAAHQYARRHGIKLSVRAEPPGMRVYRLEKE